MSAPGGPTNLPSVMINSPYRPVSVLTHEEGPVGGHGQPRGATPYAGIVDHEPGEKVLVDSGRLAVLNQCPHHLEAGTCRPVPRSVKRNEEVPAIGLGK